MVDGGSEFDNNQSATHVQHETLNPSSTRIFSLDQRSVERDECKVTGNIEKGYVTPDLGEDKYDAMDLPASWQTTWKSSRSTQ